MRFFFFLRIRRPPRSPLFPYPTLFRSAATRHAGSQPASCVPARGEPRARLVGLPAAGLDRTAAAGRSEEHTSELQSQSNLVCRLLLEKKNTRLTPQILYHH